MLGRCIISHPSQTNPDAFMNSYGKLKLSDKIKRVFGVVVNIDPSNNSVTVEANSEKTALKYDRLVIALGVDSKKGKSEVGFF